MTALATKETPAKAAGPSMKLIKTKAAAKPEEPVSEAAAATAETKEETKSKTGIKTKQELPATESITDGDLIVKTAHEIENLKEEKAFKMVPELLNDIDHDYFKLGGVLCVIQEQGWFMNHGFENFRAYVEAECGLQYRKAMYLIQIYNGLIECGVKWDQVKHLGWTKLKELSSILTTENVDEWVGLAENMTVLQLQEHIKAKTAAAPGESGDTAPSTEKVTTMTFKLHEDQKSTIKEALEKCKHETGTEFDGVALEHIALDYLGGESKLKTLPTLAEMMMGKSPEEVLEVFGEVFPDVALTAELPE